MTAFWSTAEPTEITRDDRLYEALQFQEVYYGW